MHVTTDLDTNGMDEVGENVHTSKETGYASGETLSDDINQRQPGPKLPVPDTSNVETSFDNPSEQNGGNSLYITDHADRKAQEGGKDKPKQRTSQVESTENSGASHDFNVSMDPGDELCEVSPTMTDLTGAGVSAERAAMEIEEHLFPNAQRAGSVLGATCASRETRNGTSRRDHSQVRRAGGVEKDVEQSPLAGDPDVEQSPLAGDPEGIEQSPVAGDLEGIKDGVEREDPGINNYSGVPEDDEASDIIPLRNEDMRNGDIDTHMATHELDSSEDEFTETEDEQGEQYIELKTTSSIRRGLIRRIRRVLAWENLLSLLSLDGKSGFTEYTYMLMSSALQSVDMSVTMPCPRSVRCTLRPFLSTHTLRFNERAGANIGGAIMQVVFIAGDRAGHYRIGYSLLKEPGDLASAPEPQFHYTVVVE